MRIDDIVRELDAVTEAARTAFGRLSDQQLNWKPAPDRWSVAQCLDHLITINRLYFPLLDALAAGTTRPTLWERVSPFSGLLGGLLVKSLRPENAKKMKTSPKAEPSASTIAPDIVDRLARHQSEVAARVRALPASLDLGQTIVTSPLIGWVTYSLDDCLTMLAMHEHRHLQQARRVTTAGGFPPSPGAP